MTALNGASRIYPEGGYWPELVVAVTFVALPCALELPPLGASTVVVTVTVSVAGPGLSDVELSRVGLLP